VVILVITTALIIIFFLYDPQITENSFIRILNSSDNKIQIPLNVSDEDLNDILTINTVVKPRHASISQVDPNNKIVTLIPEKGYSGIDRFSFFVKDQNNEKSNTSTSTFMINCEWNQNTTNSKIPFDKNMEIGYRPYSDTSLGIKFYYPIEWEISPIDKSKLGYYTLGYTLNPVKKNLDRGNINLQILVSPLESSFKNILLEARKSNFETYNTTYLDPLDPILFNDRCASQEMFTSKGLTFYAIKILIDDKMYNFLYTASLHEFDKSLLPVKKIIGSIELKNK
jgi:hypothetical protein